VHELKYIKNKHSRPQPTSNTVRLQPPKKIALQDGQPWNNQSVKFRQREAPSGSYLSQEAAWAPVEEEVVVMYVGTLLDPEPSTQSKQFYLGLAFATQKRRSRSLPQ
jgi:hypothetical protein